MLHNWDYKSPFVQDRLDASLRFVQRFLAPNFDGVFVEIGAYNGDFTRRLLDAFPKASIAASDITDATWPIGFRVPLQKADMLSVGVPAECGSKPTVLLMLECLYYLPQQEREKAIRRLAGMLSNLRWAFVSGPISDPVRYFDEGELQRTFGSVELCLKDLWVLNTIPAFACRFSWGDDWRISLFHRLRHILGPRYRQMQDKRAKQLNHLEAGARLRLLNDATYRRKWAHQVIYAFSR